MTPSLDLTVIDETLSDDDEIFEEALEVQESDSDSEDYDTDVVVKNRSSHCPSSIWK